MARVFAPVAFRYNSVDYRYGWQDMPDALADQLFSAGHVKYNDNQMGEPIRRSPSSSRYAQIGNSLSYQNGIRNAGGKTAWDSEVTKAVNDVIIPRHVDLTSGYWPHLYYTCVQAGKTAKIEPKWPLNIGGRVTDGACIWEATGNRAQAVAGDVCAWNMGPLTVAQMLSGQRLQEVYISGRSGKRCEEILRYVDYALDCNPDIFHFGSLFENDIWYANTAPDLSVIQSTWAMAEAAMDRVRDLGITVWVQTLYPHGSADGSGSIFTGYSAGTATKAWHWLNAKIREYARRRPDVKIWECSHVLVDPNPTNPIWPENTVTYLSPAGSGQALKKTDGIHPYLSGIWLLGKSLADFITANVAEVNHFTLAINDNAISTNPLHYGTSGTKGASTYTPTGIGPANLFSAFSYGANVSASVLSKVARTDGIAGEWTQQTYVITGASTALSEAAVLNQTTNLAIASSPFAAGDIVQSFAEIEVDANPTRLFNLQLASRFVGSAKMPYAYSINQPSSDQDTGQMLTSNTRLIMKTVPVKVPSDTTYFVDYMRAQSGGADASFTVRYGRMTRKRVTVPDIA